MRFLLGTARAIVAGALNSLDRDYKGLNCHGEVMNSSELP